MTNNFKEFKEKILSSLTGKIESFLDEKKKELSSTYFMSEEELNEFKKKTLGNYIKKADDDSQEYIDHKAVLKDYDSKKKLKTEEYLEEISRHKTAQYYIASEKDEKRLRSLSNTLKSAGIDSSKIDQKANERAKSQDHARVRLGIGTRAEFEEFMKKETARAKEAIKKHKQPVDFTDYIVKDDGEFWVGREDPNSGIEVTKPGDEIYFMYEGSAYTGIVSDHAEGRDDDMYRVYIVKNHGKRE